MAGRFELVLTESQDNAPIAQPNTLTAEQGYASAPLIARDEEQGHTVLKYADIVMDLASLRVKRGTRYIQLRPNEFRLLRLLLEQPERAFTRDQLKAGVWGHCVKLDPRSINTYLGRLRRALTGPGEPNVIRTITGYGYSLDSN